MADQETREIVETPQGRRLRIRRTRTEVHEYDLAAVDRMIGYLNARIQRLGEELQVLRDRRDDLLAKREELAG